MFSLLGINIVQDSGTTCVGDMDYVDELIVQTLLPFFLAMMLYFVYFTHRVYISKLFDGSQSFALEEKIRDLKSLYSQLFLSLTYLLLTATVTKIFRMFPCHDVDAEDESDSDGPEYYLRVHLCNMFLLHFVM